jgi:hypothetical protein
MAIGHILRSNLRMRHAVVADSLNMAICKNAYISEIYKLNGNANRKIVQQVLQKKCI